VRRRTLLWLAYGTLLLGVTLAGLEALAWVITPSWPGYLLRPAPVSLDAVARWHAGMPEVPYTINSWLMRDRERSVGKPAGVAFRSVFVGDSFLEGGFTRAALPSRVEGLLVEQGRDGVEAINLGVAGTGPIEYFYRIREVALKLSPDAVVLMLYSGNDIIAETFAEQRALLPFVAELPQPSVLGSVAPHLTWQAVNALRLHGAARGGRYAPNEMETISEAVRRPAAEGLPMLVRLMHAYYFPELEEKRIHEILARGGERFWSEFRPRRFDREYLQGWILYGLISWEIGTKPLPLTEAEAEAVVPTYRIDATMSWLREIERLVRAGGRKFLIAHIPVGSVDPDVVEFWRPWPRYYSYTLQHAAVHRAIVRATAQAGLPAVDLEKDLGGIRGTYRKTDMHWTERGHEVVAERMAREVAALRN
jgi:hypothetical protein